MVLQNNFMRHCATLLIAHNIAHQYRIMPRDIGTTLCTHRGFRYCARVSRGFSVAHPKCHAFWASHRHYALTPRNTLHNVAQALHREATSLFCWLFCPTMWVFGVFCTRFCATVSFICTPLVIVGCVVLSTAIISLHTFY